MRTFNPFAPPIIPRDSALPSRRHSMDREPDAEEEKASKAERGRERIRGNSTTSALPNATSVTGASARKAKGAS